MPLIDRVDQALGDGVDRLVTAHHRRRLRRLGWGPDFPGTSVEGGVWSRGDPPPRPGNRVEVLVDGAEALPRMAEAMRGARSHVHIASWHLDGGFALERDGAAIARLRDLLGELAERVEVRVLMWAGAPVPVFPPKRRDVEAARAALVRGTKIACSLDKRERPMHCHHEKLVVIDDEVAFVGGIDMTSLGGDRFDSSAHPVRDGIGWHDAGAELRGPAVADVAGHLAGRWRAITGEALAPVVPPGPAGDLDVQVVRTVPERVYPFAPRGDFRILEAYLRALRSAQRLVHLENQFLWSPELASVLAGKLREPPHPDFRLVVVLPAKPNNGADDTRGQLAALLDADAGAGRVLACTLRSRTGTDSGPLYVHAKIGIVDDAWLTIGSANLNAHSLYNDSEMNLVTCDPALARDTRLRLWAEHLERDVAEVDGDPARVFDELWRPTAREQLERSRHGLHATHRLIELPGVSRRSARLLGPLQSLVVDG